MLFSRRSHWVWAFLWKFYKKKAITIGTAVKENKRREDKSVITGKGANIC